VIANPVACRFNPDTLACPTGAGTNSCLTPPQLTALKKMYAGAGNRGRIGEFGTGGVAFVTAPATPIGVGKGPY
jgi:hypothetical protein